DAIHAYLDSRCGQWAVHLITCQSHHADTALPGPRDRYGEEIGCVLDLPSREAIIEPRALIARQRRRPWRADRLVKRITRRQPPHQRLLPGLGCSLGRTVAHIASSCLVMPLMRWTGSSRWATTSAVSCGSSAVM